MVELGISTFGETTPLEKTGDAYSHDERIRQLVHGPCETIPAICHNRCFIKWQSRDYGWSWILYGVFSLVWL